MSSPAAHATLDEPAGGRGFAQHWLGVYTAPAAEFHAIARAPRFWAPLIAFATVTLAFTVVWMSKVDPTEYMRARMEESPQADRTPPEQKTRVVEAQARYFKPIGLAGTRSRC